MRPLARRLGRLVAFLLLATCNRSPGGASATAASVAVGRADAGASDTEGEVERPVGSGAADSATSGSSRARAQDASSEAQPVRGACGPFENVDAPCECAVARGDAVECAVSATVDVACPVFQALDLLFLGDEALGVAVRGADGWSFGPQFFMVYGDVPTDARRAVRCERRTEDEVGVWWSEVCRLMTCGTRAWESDTDVLETTRTDRAGLCTDEPTPRCAVAGILLCVAGGAKDGRPTEEELRSLRLAEGTRTADVPLCPGADWPAWLEEPIPEAVR
ncbi:MAG: hypothetical protein JXB32_06290 [Deltaproteobacteria bacterium]|nr:hypothetical protein [Deltaproteobacteria bacterium]